MKLKADFHPRLFGFAGFSGSGKTTLIEKIIKELKDFRIGYIKHDAHAFELDHEGKDSYRQFHAGAQLVYINDPSHFALQGRGESFSLEKEFFKDCELTIVEGHKYSEHPKFLFLDREGLAEKELHEGKIKGVIACITLDPFQKGIKGLPTFNRDEVQGICSFITEAIEESLAQTELCALVLAGGRSSRMGKDKALIDYHGKPQAVHMQEVLQRLHLKTYLSLRAEQKESFQMENVITDRFLEFGPLGGILSAMKQFKQTAFLVVACDLPLITENNIRELMEARDPLKQATAFYNQERKQFEPLFAIYEPSIYSRMLHFLADGIECPQKVLFNVSVKKLLLKSQSFLENVNTPEEMEMARTFLNGAKA